MKRSKQIKRGIYLVPNALTIAGLFAGFYAVVAAMKGFYDVAAIAIFIAMIFDGFDGRVARMTRTESTFGAELDSLADIVSFGIAPALVIYSWALQDLHKAGWLASFIFVAAGAMRLARFNTQATSASKQYFQGLPIPAAAGVLASSVLLCTVYNVSVGFWLSVLVAIITAGTGLLMISRVRYYSFKDFNFRHKIPFILLLLLLLIVVVIVAAPVITVFVLFYGYAISGLLISIFYFVKRRRYLQKRLNKAQRLKANEATKD